MKLIAVFCILFAVLVKIKCEECSDVKRWGFICLDERTSGTCINVGSQWITLPGKDCQAETDNNKFCNMNSMGCSSTPSNFGNFKCMTSGLFPNPWDCGKYFVCKEDTVPISIECPAGKAFSTRTDCCSEVQTQEFCARRTIACDYLGQVGPLPENNNFFYYCHIPTGVDFIYPQIVKCPQSQIFENGNCMPASGREAGGTTPTTGTATTTKAPPSGNTGQCTTPGIKSKDPTNCRDYYYCDIRLVSTKYTCGPIGRFDEGSQKCFAGNCT